MSAQQAQQPTEEEEYGRYRGYRHGMGRGPQMGMGMGMGPQMGMGMGPRMGMGMGMGPQMGMGMGMGPQMGMGPMACPQCGPMGYYYPPGPMAPGGPTWRLRQPPYRAAAKMSDEDIRREINRIITTTPGLEAAKIKVEVQQGVVTLSGQVPSPMAKRQIEAMVYPLPGVVDVKDNLTIAGR